MAKKLLNVRFASLGGTLEYNLGCNSSDNLPQAMYTQAIQYDSENVPLNQTGGLIVAGFSSSNTWLYMKGIYDVMNNMGYGTRNLMPKSALVENVKCYLNGVQYDEYGTQMPYVMWEDTSFSDAVLNYYRADGTRLGQLVQSPYASNSGAYCGQLFEDGTFTGDAITLDPISLGGGLYSKRHYEWGWPATKLTNQQIVPTSIIADLKEYLPIEPEGEFTDNGNGDFDTTSDAIDFPDLPSLSVINTGMTSIYEMSSTQLQDLSHYLWTTNFEQLLQKMFNDPMEAILNLSIVPVDLTSDALTSSVRIGNVTTTVQGNRLSSQYKSINFGTINMKEYWANFGDYSPYTKLSIFLPYVGTQQISIDDVQNGSIQLKGVIDVLTGTIQYMLYSVQGNRRNHGHKSVLYSWGGNCQYQVPLSASNMTSVVTSLVGATGTIAGAVGATVATGGMTAPIAIGTVGSAVSNIMNAKTHVQRGGGLGGAVGLFGVQTPYLILERPEQITPKNYNATMGVPCEQTDYLKNYEGFIKVKGVNLTIDKATQNELTQIESLLKGGVLV